MNRRSGPAERFAARRTSEDESTPLREAAPDLLTCRIELTDGRAEAALAEVNHVRHLVVARAPSVIFVACGDPSCREGGHDISYALLRGFRERREEITGQDPCNGTFGTASCGRILRFVAKATYRPATP